jgi:hypothetical protein
MDRMCPLTVSSMRTSAEWPRLSMAVPMNRNEELTRRAREHAKRHSLHLGHALGFGIHGIVFAAKSQIEAEPSPGGRAIKVHEHEAAYLRERDVYHRLHEQGVLDVRGCEVPRMLRWDDALLVIEMTIVSPPFVLDFAGAYLDRAPDFSEEVWADWRVDKAEQFGTRWPEVQAILRHLEFLGVYMEDVSPSNISFRD